MVNDRSCLLTSPSNTDHTGGIVAITDEMVEALSSAAWHSETGALKKHHDALVAMLRLVAPSDETLAHLDKRARESGFVRAGTDEQIPDASWMHPGARVTVSDPTSDGDFNGVWVVRDVDGERVSLQQGNSYCVATADRLEPAR